MENNNELVKTEESKALSKEGDMFSRLKYMVTNGKKLNNDECAALAQFAVVEGLNPFAQECWYIPNVGPSIGIGGLRKKATQALGSGHTWNVQFKDVTDDYRNIEDKAIKYAFEATLRDTKSMSDYMKAYKEAKEIFATAEEIINVVGRPPIWQAVGVFLESQADQYKDKFFIQKERAKKRAEALVIKKRFSLSYEYGDVDDDQDNTITIGFEKESNIVFEGETTETQEMIEGEVIEKSTSQKPEVKTETKKSTRPFEPETLKEMIGKKAEQHNGKVMNQNQNSLMVGMLEALFAGGNSEVQRKELCQYLTGYASSKEIPENFKLALLDWLKPVKDSGGAYMPDAMAQREAQTVVKQFLIENGQGELL